MYTDPTPLAMWIAGVLGVSAFAMLAWIIVYDWLDDRRRKRRRLAERARMQVTAPKNQEEFS